MPNDWEQALEFNAPLIPGILLKRYKRFLADIKLDDGRFITAHCPNSGSMKTCKEPGWRVLVSDSNNAKRKLRYTWELVHNGTCWIGINTQRPNHIAREAIEKGKIPELCGYTEIRSEAPYGRNSRIDLLLTRPEQTCFVEVKNVTLVEKDHFLFPDAVTTRGQKHLDELMAMVKEGHRAVMLFVIQRKDGNIFMPAADIDPVYAARLEEAHHNGVEILPWLADVSPEKIELDKPVKYIFRP